MWVGFKDTVRPYPVLSAVVRKQLVCKEGIVGIGHLGMKYDGAVLRQRELCASVGFAEALPSLASPQFL